MFIFPSPYVAPTAGGLTLSLQDSATSTATTITAPSSIDSGDLLVLLDSSVDFSTPSTVIPSGFTSIGNISSAQARQIASYKIADGSEDSASLTGMSTSFAEVRKALYQFRGSSAIGSVTVASVNGQATDSNPTSQSVTASGGTPPLIVFGCYGDDGSGSIDPRTFSPAKDGEITPNNRLYLAYKIYNSSPADVSVDMDDEGTQNLLQSFYIECST